MPKKTEKRVKAWLCFWGPKDKEPQLIFHKLPGITTAPLDVICVPCTITYSLPSQGKGEKLTK